MRATSALASWVFRLLAVIVVSACLCVGQAVNIRLAHDSSAEQQAKEQLERLLKQHDTSKYTFTRDVIIEERVIPHSHPVLTLNTRHLKQNDEAPSAYLHEQIHWFLTGRQQQTEAAEVELRKMYPNPPVGGDEGAQDLESDYLHLIVCELEREADQQLLGPDRTDSVMQFWANDHYKWVYCTVIEDHANIQDVVKRHSLEIT
jgi:hypothetical protein